MLPIIHILGAFLLLIFVGLALFSNKHSKIYEMISRVLYIVLLVSGAFFISKGLTYNPIHTVMKIALALLTISVIEVAFAKKNRNKLTMSLLVIVIILIIITVIFGLTGMGYHLF